MQAKVKVTNKHKQRTIARAGHSFVPGKTRTVIVPVGKLREITATKWFECKVLDVDEEAEESSPLGSTLGAPLVDEVEDVEYPVKVDRGVYELSNGDVFEGNAKAAKAAEAALHEDEDDGDE